MSDSGEPQVTSQIATGPVEAATARSWTCHWQNRYWRPHINRENAPVRGSGSNSFQKRGVSPGDVVYIISLLDGQLLLGGKTVVDRIVPRKEAMQVFKTRNLFDAREWTTAGS